MTKKPLHDTVGLVMSEAAESVSEESPTSKGGGGKMLVGFLLGAAVVGGITAIVLSGGTAVPAIIVALEAAGDVVVGTELVDVTVGNAP